MSFYVNHDDRIVKAAKPIISAGNRGLRYGDGLFETMKMTRGKISLLNDHLERLFQGMECMGFEPPAHFTSSYLENKINELCRLNGHSDSARVRLMIFRGDGNLYDPRDLSPHYLLETFLLTETEKKGITAGLYRTARKAIDGFSHIKSNNYQPYLQAALHAHKAGWEESILFNTDGHICESAVSNIFIIKNGIIITPPLSQGCIAGVMRKHLLGILPGLGFSVTEAIVTSEMLAQADEVFLTNAVQGIRWVSRLEDIAFDNTIIKKIQDAVNR